MFNSVLSNKKIYLNEKHEEILSRYIEPQIIERYLHNKEFDELYILADRKIPNNIVNKKDILDKLMDLRVRKEIDRSCNMQGSCRDIYILCTVFIIIGILNILLIL